MDDKTLERMASQLGDDAAARIDVEATAEAVLRRLRTEPVRTPWWRQARVLQGAAAAVVILVAGMFAINRGGDEIDLLDADLVPVSLESLSDEELAEVADSLLFEAPVYEQMAIGLEDLDEDQLVELLELMEG